jgi:peroxiredoxin
LHWKKYHQRTGQVIVQELTGLNAPEFELPDADGRPYRLADFAGKWLLLMFHRHLA